MSPTSSIEAADVPSLRPSRYDRVAGLLISVLILSGTSTAMLFVLWLSTHQTFRHATRLFGEAGYEFFVIEQR